MKVVVIPATYNEKGNIERLITLMEEEVFPKIKDHDMYILVADDNSPDGTADVVRSLMKKYKNLDINLGEKKGLGAAYIRVMSYAIEKQHADIVISIDGDMQFDPREIPKYLKKIDDGYDIVTGTRYSEGGSIPQNWPLHRKAFSIFGNIIVRLITWRFYLHDWTGGFRAYRKEVFLKERENLRLFSGYTFQVAALYKAILDGYKIGEVPIHFSDRTLGHSKIAPLEYILNLLKYVITERINELKRFIKFLIVGGTGFMVQLTTQEFFARIIFSSLATVSLRDGSAAAFGAEAAIINNFMFNNFWTFSDTKHMKESSHFFVKFVKFNLAAIASIFIQFSSVFIFVHLLGEDIIFGDFTIKTRIAILFPTIIFLVIPLNYIIYNKIIWKTHHLKKQKSN